MFCVCQGLRVIIKAFSDLNRSNSFIAIILLDEFPTCISKMFGFFFLKLKVQLISYDELSPIKQNTDRKELSNSSEITHQYISLPTTHIWFKDHYFTEEESTIQRQKN